MIHVINNAVLNAPTAISASGATIPFDTVVLNTNGNLALSTNTIQEKVTGVYDTICQVCVSNSGSADVAATLTAYADGNAIPGAFVTETVAATSGTAFLTLNWPVNVVSSNSGTATISWRLTGGALSLVNANATVFRHI